MAPSTRSEYSSDTIAFLAMSSIPGIGPASLRAIADAVRGGVSWDDIRSNPRPLIKGRTKVSAAETIRSEWTLLLQTAESRAHRWAEQGIRIFTMLDPGYPSRLREIEDPPVLLYARGNTRMLREKKGVAVIGARASTPFGDGIAFELGAALAHRGYNVVSGLARGIDTAAHRGALSVGGVTTAVVVDVETIYPPENAGLASDIVAGGGLLLAEYPPGQRATRRCLIERDRIQSALAFAVFPVETGTTGGTVYTLGYAAEQKRAIFCPDPEELRMHSTPQYREGIERVVREGAATYKTSQIVRAVEELE